MFDPYSMFTLGIVIVGFIIAFVLAFGIGANDVANSFGTSVGSGVLTIRQACLLATFCEIAGSVLIGYKVSNTMRKGILEVSLYKGDETTLMLGNLTILAGSAVWLLFATYKKLPISGTHSIVGSTMGFTILARGWKGVNWRVLGRVFASWIISPLLSGFISTVLYVCVRQFILRRDEPLKAGFFALPLFYSVTVFVNIFSIVHDGPELLYMNNIPLWLVFAISIGFGALAGILVRLFVVPWQKRKILGHSQVKKPVKFSIEGSRDSTPSGSPKKNRRPTSLVTEGQPLPSITETTELVSFRDAVPPHANDRNLTKNLDFCDFSTLSPMPNGKNYKIDPKIIEKAEHLLGKTSLDNTDLTITSLNYIDEQQNGVTVKGHFDRQQSYRSPVGSMGQRDVRMSPNLNGDVTIPITDLPELPNKVHVETNPDLCNANSAGSLDNMIPGTLSPISSKVPLIDAQVKATQKDEPEDVAQLFSFLQILTASFGSFAHGGNDVSNAIGPLIAIFMIYMEGSVMQESETPIWILFFGGVGISIGLWLWGRRVIETIGNDLTKITPSTGFTIEIGAAMTVLLASKIGLPISTTHCKVGSVVIVGYVGARKNTPEEKAAGIQQESPVDWKLFRSILWAWLVTVPAAAVLSAMFMAILQLVL
ncbi:Sodium-dependent phosphate transporter 2 [Pseudolycoriella hygida]|uniref:Phosphate transporter n=1 Tax=Pseudolycoriella hygida TaxID=35572 RepID=A0A9Q0RX84_9DIPT|nr:Sodium-dependent phosphate transporter 2 [Pseudolycoriella hygida]